MASHPSSQLIFAFPMSTVVLSNYLMFMNCYSYMIQIFRHPTFIAAMGNSPSAPEGCQSVATTSNMDANYQYSGQEWRPGPPTVMDLTKYIADSENPQWWSIQCATDGCTSWLYLVKTRHPQFQRCHHCNKPWVESFFQLGPHKVWHGSEEAANN